MHIRGIRQTAFIRVHHARRKNLYMTEYDKVKNEVRLYLTSLDENHIEYSSKTSFYQFCQRT